MRTIKMEQTFCIGITVGYAHRILKISQSQSRPQTLFYDTTKGTEENPVYVSYEKAFEQLESYRERGFECVPWCDHTDEKGNCLGHKDE